MFSLLCRRSSLSLVIPTNIFKFSHFQIQKPHNFCSISQNQISPTVSYLINKCGVPLDSAIKASQKIQIDSTEQPDSVLQLLRSYHFTQTQIANLIVKYPLVLLFDPLKTLQPKLEFFESVGLSRPEIAKIVSSYKQILFRSLSNQIMPTYSFLKRYMEIDRDVVTALLQVQCGFVDSKNFHLAGEFNIEFLRNHGVPDVNIDKLLMRQPRVLSLEHDRLKEIVGWVKGMEFDPHSASFVEAIGVMGAIGESGWDNKMEAYKGFGWFEEDVIAAFKLQPRCMLVSVKKIKKMLNFYLNELGLALYDVARYPNLVMVSLEDRIIPRCSVLQILEANGLIEKGSKLMWLLNSSKKDFEKKCIAKYQETIPEVLEAYKGQLGYPKLEMLR